MVSQVDYLIISSEGHEGLFVACGLSRWECLRANDSRPGVERCLAACSQLRVMEGTKLS